MVEREELARVLLALQPIAHDHRPATPPNFSADDPEDWTTGTPATHKLAFPPRGPMVDAVIDAILASDWLRARDQRVREECAKVAEEHGRTWGLGYVTMTDTIAAAIRGDAK